MLNVTMQSPGSCPELGQCRRTGDGKPLARGSGLGPALLQAARCRTRDAHNRTSKHTNLLCDTWSGLFLWEGEGCHVPSPTFRAEA